VGHGETVRGDRAARGTQEDGVSRRLIDGRGRTSDTIDLARMDLATIDLATIDLDTTQQAMTAAETIGRAQVVHRTRVRHDTPARHVTPGRHDTPARLDSLVPRTTPAHPGKAARQPMPGDDRPRPAIGPGRTARRDQDRTDLHHPHLALLVRAARGRRTHATDTRIAGRHTARTDTRALVRAATARCRHRDRRPCRRPTRSALTRS
jgi:hypothetical protein